MCEKISWKLGNREIAAGWKLGVFVSRALWRYQKLEHMCETGGHYSMSRFGFTGATPGFGGATACYRLLRPHSDFWTGGPPTWKGGPSLRVECLLKTDNGYPKDTGVTLFTLATPGNPLRYNTHRSAPPVSALAHSRGQGARQAEGLLPRSRPHTVWLCPYRSPIHFFFLFSRLSLKSDVSHAFFSQNLRSDIVLACTESATSEYSTTSQCLGALLGRPGRVKFILNGLRWKKNQRTYHSYTTSAWRLIALRCN